MNYEVTMTRRDGHVFNHGYATLDEVREMLALYAIVLLPGEMLTWRTL